MSNKKSYSIHLTRRSRKALTGYLFASPWLAGLAIFQIYAISMVVYYSLTDFGVFNAPNWIGLDNFRELFDDPLVLTSLYNTFYYVIISIPLAIIMAFSLALLLDQKVKGLAAFRLIFYLPAVVPIVASATLWLWILAPSFGILNYLLGLLGIRGPGWFASLTWAKPALIIMAVWGGAGPSMIIVLAGLQGIPREFYEAAEIDGAGVWKKFIFITIPAMAPTLLFLLIMGIIGSFQVFTQAFVTTQGGPGRATLFYVLYLYNNAFRQFRMGYASALALILLLIIMSFTLLVVWKSKKWIYYMGKR